jgi:hypothetical protein
MIMLRRSLVWLVVLALAACASAGRQPETGSANVITRSELDAVGSLSTYDAVQRLRPVFLRDRGPTSLLSAGARTRPAVFIDMTEYGELESLRALPASHVQEVRFYPGSQATTKFGSTYGAGVVQVTMRVQ